MHFTGQVSDVLPTLTTSLHQGETGGNSQAVYKYCFSSTAGNKNSFSLFTLQPPGRGYILTGLQSSVFFAAVRPQPSHTKDIFSALGLQT